ncbi:hypothetical protein KAR91_79100 [Candidatus Pacearchaeota archaeon]|nr:hypothetical protein [Candidatus Pacearchaeota archaeon]
MTDKEAIMYLEATYYPTHLNIKYREEEGTPIPMNDRLLSESLGIVLGIAKSKLAGKVIDDIIKE